MIPGRWSPIFMEREGMSRELLLYLDRKEKKKKSISVLDFVRLCRYTCDTAL